MEEQHCGLNVERTTALWRNGCDSPGRVLFSWWIEYTEERKSIIKPWGLISRQQSIHLQLLLLSFSVYSCVGNHFHVSLANLLGILSILLFPRLLVLERGASPNGLWHRQTAWNQRNPVVPDMLQLLWTIMERLTWRWRCDEVILRGTCLLISLFEFTVLDSLPWMLTGRGVADLHLDTAALRRSSRAASGRYRLLKEITILWLKHDYGGWGWMNFRSTISITCVL